MKEDPEIEWPSQMSWKSKKYHNCEKIKCKYWCSMPFKNILFDQGGN